MNRGKKIENTQPLKHQTNTTETALVNVDTSCQNIHITAHIVIDTRVSKQQFKTQCKDDRNHAFKTAKITVFERTLCTGYTNKCEVG